MLRLLTDSELVTLSEMRDMVQGLRRRVNTFIRLWFSPWRNYYDDSTLVGWAAGGMTNTLIYVMTLGPLVFVQYHINGLDDGATNTCSFTVPYPQRNIAGLAMRAVGHRDETVGGYDHNTIVLEPNEQQVHLHYSGAGDPAGWPVGGARNVWGQFWYLR